MLNNFKIDNETKSGQCKKGILNYFVANGNSTIQELAKEVNLSVPTVTKALGELLNMGYINEYGKQETGEGRHPTLYGLNPDSGYFGVAVSALCVYASCYAEQHVENLILVHVRLVDKLLNEFAQLLDRLHCVVDAAWFVVLDINEVASEIDHSKIDKAFLNLYSDKICKHRKRYKSIRLWRIYGRQCQRHGQPAVFYLT